MNEPTLDIRYDRRCGDFKRPFKIPQRPGADMERICDGDGARRDHLWIIAAGVLLLGALAAYNVWPTVLRWLTGATP